MFWFSHVNQSLSKRYARTVLYDMISQAIQLKPNYSDAYNNLASTYMQLGKTDEAIQTYQMALVLNPALVDAHSNLGNLYKATGQTTA